MGGGSVLRPHRWRSTHMRVGGIVELTYDAMDRLTRAVNEDGAVTEHTRDGKGRVTAIEDAHGSYRYLEHDAEGNLKIGTIKGVSQIAPTPKQTPCITA